MSRGPTRSSSNHTWRELRRKDFGCEGLSANRLYMLNLDAEIAATRTALVGTAVTEIATLRAELSGPDVG